MHNLFQIFYEIFLIEKSTLDALKIAYQKSICKIKKQGLLLQEQKLTSVALEYFYFLPSPNSLNLQFHSKTCTFLEFISLIFLNYEKNYMQNQKKKKKKNLESHTIEEKVFCLHAFTVKISIKL